MAYNKRLLTWTADPDKFVRSRFMRRLTRALIKRRESLGLGQQELADRAGLLRSYVSDIECGARNITLGTLCVLAAALELNPSDLLIETEKAMEGRRRRKPKGYRSKKVAASQLRETKTSVLVVQLTTVKFMRSFSQVLKMRRKSIALSQEEVAIRAGIHRTHVSNVERFGGNITLRTLCLLSAALELAPSELLIEAEKTAIERKEETSQFATEMKTLNTRGSGRV